MLHTSKIYLMNRNKISIFETLSKLGLTSHSTKELFSKKTRDVPDLKVFKDKISGVIYIDDFYVGDDDYRSGSYRENEPKEIKFKPPYTDAI